MDFYFLFECFELILYQSKQYYRVQRQVGASTGLAFDILWFGQYWISHKWCSCMWICWKFNFQTCITGTLIIFIKTIRHATKYLKACHAPSINFLFDLLLGWGFSVIHSSIKGWYPFQTIRKLVSRQYIKFLLQDCEICTIVKEYY